ncbi:hypothetical protein B0F90DRAFT_1818571 [Multifurca ochricompacta]|uniref:Uncharacterized protein n=1 Tax=Multifurca ochricompacta TaxID=376703 RepID=A0AAD4QL86_9AGAM|nr:hypothetical protein B0F90DRAFT_1818571 [Multifurca ochricompacta]
MASLIRHAMRRSRCHSSLFIARPDTLPGQLAIGFSGCSRRSSDARRTFFRSGFALPTSLNPRVGTIFLGLVGLGFISTMIGVYEFYSSFFTWPPEVRSDLRAGVKAKQQGNLALSRKLLTQALETALSLPPDLFSPSPYLKLSGIAITLGEVLEEDNQPKKAYETYLTALEHLQGHWSSLTSEEKLRAISIGQKLGEMVDVYQLGDEEEERWLTWSVEEVLKLAKDVGSAGPGEESRESHLVLSDLGLPKWFCCATLSPHDILLVPPATSPRKATAEELCRGAQLMSNLSELFMRNTPTPAALHQSEHGPDKPSPCYRKRKEMLVGLTMFGCAKKRSQSFYSTLGRSVKYLKQMNDDSKSARPLFERSLEQSKKLRSQEGIILARNAIRRLDRKQLDASLHPSPPPDAKSGSVPNE